jgi:hypothetical protein
LIYHIVVGLLCHNNSRVCETNKLQHLLDKRSETVNTETSGDYKVELMARFEETV